MGGDEPAEERKQLRIALDAAALGTWRHDLRSGRLRLDARGQQHYGLNDAEVEIGDVFGRVHPDDRDRLAGEMTAVLGPDGIGHHVTEYRVSGVDGVYRLLRVHVRVEYEGEGEQRHAVLGYGTSEDVTARRRAERQLADQAQLLRDVGEIAQIGGWDFDPVTGEGKWTDETLRIHGVVGQPDAANTGLDRFPGEARDRIEAALAAAVAHGTPYDLELPFVSASGEAKWVRAVCRPVVADGRVVRLRGALQDVTAQKRLEEQLRQSQKLEAVGQLAGGVAHDFNNLLTVISGNLELLAELAGDSTDERRLVDEIRAAAERAAALTRQLLAFGRKSVLQPRAVAIDTLLADIERMLRRIIGEDVTIRTSLAAGDAHVMADEAQLEQVLLNLVLNARDAMPAGGVLTLATAVVPSGEPSQPAWVRLTVADTGAGMSPEVKRHIFEPFFTTKPIGRGTGLGLATVFGIVRQSAGRIDVQSTLGQGSTFVIDLPLTASRASDASVGRPSGPGHETVLLVEDDSAVRRIAARSLVQRGYRVLDWPGPAEVLAAAATLPRVDLLVSDVVMPAMSGPELTDALRRDHPDLRVLYISGYVRDALEQRGLQPGEVLLQKPFSGSELVRRVREVLDAP